MDFETISPENINDDTIRDFLTLGAVDFDHHEGIYVTGHDYNFWVKIHDHRHLLVLWSYHDLADGVDELDALKFCNKANKDKIMLQFSVSKDRLYAYYSFPYAPVGLAAQTVLKLCQNFSGIMSKVVDEGMDAGILESCPQSSREAASDDAQHETKH
ncbi:hypothetical protein [Novosphingobium acidiphilum]|uniref:hypothetical protein n=1 Tax=Novosphingobium acidiphilum TaxID=505248 RepID=UPI0012EC2389|nr:hypothetical protein [Novosphingobium acidiphilum]